MDGLSLNINNDEQFIDNTNSVFTQTKYSKCKFKIFYIKLTRQKRAELQAVNTKVIKVGGKIIDKLNEANFETRLFISQITNWEGITTLDGTQVPYSKPNAKLMAEHEQEFTNLINMAIMDNSAGIMQKIMQDKEREFEEKPIDVDVENSETENLNEQQMEDEESRNF